MWLSQAEKHSECMKEVCQIINEYRQMMSEYKHTVCLILESCARALINERK